VSVKSIFFIKLILVVVYTVLRLSACTVFFSKVALLLMVATNIAGCCTKLSKEQNVEECDATGFNSSNTVWLITKTYHLNTVSINKRPGCSKALVALGLQGLLIK